MPFRRPRPSLCRRVLMLVLLIALRSEGVDGALCGEELVSHRTVALGLVTYQKKHREGVANDSVYPRHWGVHREPFG